MIILCLYISPLIICTYLFLEAVTSLMNVNIQVQKLSRSYIVKNYAKVKC